MKMILENSAVNETFVEADIDNNIDRKAILKHVIKQLDTGSFTRSRQHKPYFEGLPFSRWNRRMPSQKRAYCY